MYSPLSAMSKVHPPLAGEGCRGAAVLAYLRGDVPLLWWTGWESSEGGAAPQDNGDTAIVGVSVCKNPFAS